MAWTDKFFHPKSLIDDFYEFSIILKALGGVIEFISGIALLFISPIQIQQVVAAITRAELLEDPHAFIARHLTAWSNHLGHNATLFGAIYLLTHGLIKIGIVVALLLKKQWAFPVAIVVFIGFGVYEIYLTFLKASIGYGLLTIYDFFVVYLIWLEYKKARQEPAT